MNSSESMMNGIVFTLTTRLKSKHLRTKTSPSRSPLVTASSLTSRHCVESQRSRSYCSVGPALRYRSRKACKDSRGAVREGMPTPGGAARLPVLGEETSSQQTRTARLIIYQLIRPAQQSPLLGREGFLTFSLSSQRVQTVVSTGARKVGWLVLT